MLRLICHRAADWAPMQLTNKRPQPPWPPYSTCLIRGQRRSRIPRGAAYEWDDRSKARRGSDPGDWTYSQTGPPLVSRSLTNGLRPATGFQLIASPGNAAAFTDRAAALSQVRQCPSEELRSSVMALVQHRTGVPRHYVLRLPLLRSRAGTTGVALKSMMLDQYPWCACGSTATFRYYFNTPA